MASARTLSTATSYLAFLLPSAFEALFHAYHAEMCAFAYRYLGARDLAEEIVQEVFLCVWERRETWHISTGAI